MKRILFAIVMVIMGMQIHAQDETVSQYLARYKAFITEIEAMDSLRSGDYQRLDSVYNEFTNLYHSTYKEQMTDTQITTYTKYRTQYKKAIALKGSKNVTKHIDNAAETGVKAVKKAGSKVKGFLKGLFGK